MLVDADKAREKMAKACEIGMEGACNCDRCEASRDFAAAIRQTDLTDCRALHITGIDSDNVKAVALIESLSAQVAELKGEARVLVDFDDLLKRAKSRRGTDQLRRLRGENPDNWAWIHEGELIEAVESLSAQVAELKKVLIYARGALMEVSPCANPECQQIQRETLDWAIKKIDAAKEAE